MKALSGLQIWIWELAACEKGDPAAISAKAKAAGVSGVIVKCGEDGPAFEQVSASLTSALGAEGIGCSAWWYCRPQSMAAQIAMLTAVRDRAGITSFVMDAEREWDSPDQRRLAAIFAAQLRAALGPDVFVADAPWARPIDHKAPFPYAQFGAVMDARMPQFYWELAEVAGEPFAHFMDAADAEWAQTAPGAVICPTLSTVNSDGTKHAPVSELAAALDRYASRPSVSIWSWQHLSPAEWALLEQRGRAAAASAPSSPATAIADVPLEPLGPDARIPGENT